MKRCPHCGAELPDDLDALLDELGAPPDLDLPPLDLPPDDPEALDRLLREIGGESPEDE